MNKEECLEALNNLSRYANIGRAKHGAGGCVVDNFVSNNESVIYNLICDHFDNPPLKFDELEEEMWVWDNKEKMYIKSCNNFDTEENGKGIRVQMGFDLVRIKFEENRFYRKQVEE
nr:MAG TPA: hypothetical protein [Caudoviricetes sp.]